MSEQAHGACTGCGKVPDGPGETGRSIASPDGRSWHEVLSGAVKRCPGKPKEEAAPSAILTPEAFAEETYIISHCSEFAALYPSGEFGEEMRTATRDAERKIAAHDVAQRQKIERLLEELASAHKRCAELDDHDVSVMEEVRKLEAELNRRHSAWGVHQELEVAQKRIAELEADLAELSERNRNNVGCADMQNPAPDKTLILDQKEVDKALEGISSDEAE